MKHRMRKLQVAISLSVLLALIAVNLASAAVPTLPDHFNDSTPPAVGFLEIGGTPFVTSGVSSREITDGLFGNERDIYATIDYGTSGNLAIKANDNGNSQLTIASAAGMGFTVQIQWDGASDSPKDTINYTGLGSKDLTESSTHDRFALLINNSDLGGYITVKVYTSQTSCSEKRITIDGSNTNGNTITLAWNQVVYEIPFTGAGGMTQGAGCSSAANFANVGAVTLTMDTGGDDTLYGWDLNLEFMATSGPGDHLYKDYGDLPASYENYKAGSIVSEAIHVDSGLYLGNEAGSNMTVENSKTGTTAASDDKDNGVTRSTTAWTEGVNGGTINVTVSGCASTCYFIGFIDWDRDGSFWGTGWDTNERLFTTPKPVVNGTQSFSFTVPAGFGNNSYYARFRVAEKFDAVTAWGAVATGEVEDYVWTFGGSTAVDLAGFGAASPVSPFLPLTVLALPVGIGLLWMQQRRRK